MSRTPRATLIALGKLIRWCRDLAGLKQADLAKKLGYSVGWLSNVETGQLRPRRDQIIRIEKSLALPEGTLTSIYDDLKPGHPVELFERFEGMEQSASSIRSYDALAIPGLLQTEETARALLKAGRPVDRPEVVEELVARRMSRQAILERDDPPSLWMLLDETVIRRPVGGSEVHAAQLDYLVEIAERPGISVQVIPFAAGAHAGLVSTFAIFSFSEEPDIAYSEDPAMGHIHDRPDLVRTITEAYNALNASALPAAASMTFIREVKEEICPPQSGGASRAVLEATAECASKSPFSTESRERV